MTLSLVRASDPFAGSVLSDDSSHFAKLDAATTLCGKPVGRVLLADHGDIVAHCDGCVAVTAKHSPRKTRDLCQSCWQDVHPSDYAPTSERYEWCERCGDLSLVVRSKLADEYGTPDAGLTARQWAEGLTSSGTV